MDVGPITAISAYATRIPESPIPDRRVTQAAEHLNQINAFGENRELNFTRDIDTRRPVVQVIDRDTREVVLQIPSRIVLQMSAALQQGLLRQTGFH